MLIVGAAPDPAVRFMSTDDWDIFAPEKINTQENAPRLTGILASKFSFPEAMLRDWEQVKQLFPIFMAGRRFQFSQKFQDNPEKLPCLIISISGEDDGMVAHGKTEGWKNWTTAGHLSTTCPGRHLFINTHWQQVLQIVAPLLV